MRIAIDAAGIRIRSNAPFVILQNGLWLTQPRLGRSARGGALGVGCSGSGCVLVSALGHSIGARRPSSAAAAGWVSSVGQRPAPGGLREQFGAPLVGQPALAGVGSDAGSYVTRMATAEQKASSAAVISSMIGIMSG